VTLRHDWQNASRSDLHLFRRAIRERWAIPPEHCRPLMDAALAAAFQRRSFRLSHVAMRALIDAGDYDLAMRRRERAKQMAAYERAAEAAARGDIEAAVAAIESTLDTPEGLEIFDVLFGEVSRSGPSDVAQDGPSAGGPSVAAEAPDDAAATPIAPAAATAAELEARRREAEAAERRRQTERRRQEEEQRRRTAEEAERRRQTERRRQEEEEAARKAAEAARQAEGLRRYYEWAAAKEATCPLPPAGPPLVRGPQW
jgi:colicin import membrane protein